MTDIPIPEGQVRLLRTLCYILHTIYGAHTVGDYRLLAQILHIRPDAGEQAFAAALDLGARLPQAKD